MASSVKTEGLLRMNSKDKFIEQIQSVVTTADYLTTLANRVAGSIQEQVQSIKEKVATIVKGYENPGMQKPQVDCYVAQHSVWIDQICEGIRRCAGSFEAIQGQKIQTTTQVSPSSKLHQPKSPFMPFQPETEAKRYEIDIKACQVSGDFGGYSRIIAVSNGMLAAYSANRN